MIQQGNSSLITELESNTCRDACNDCVIDDVSQTIMITGFTTCLVNIARTDQMESVLTQELENQIFNQKDALGSLSRLFSGENACVSTSFVNNINSIIDEDFIKEVADNIDVSQVISMQGSSFSVKGISQDITAKIFFQAILKTESFSKLHTDIEIDAAQKIVDESTELTDLLTNLTIPIQSVLEVTENIFVTGGIILGLIIAMIFLIWFFRYLTRPVVSRTFNQLK